jgi:tryptophan 2,3-dioxygenase
MTDDAPTHRMTYGGYLQLDELLTLQDGPQGYSPSLSNDEQHFIIVHQAFELWFKLILRELKETHALLNQEHVQEEKLPQMVHHLDRVTEIFRLLSNQWKVMETLTPQGFLSFRDKLGTSSGFESWQMREMEVLLGLDNAQRMGGMDPLLHMKKLAKEGKVTDSVLADFEATSNQPSLREALSAWLGRTPINGSLAGSDGDSKAIEAFVEGHIGAMRTQGEEVIAHIVAIGHGEEAPVRARIESATDQAAEFLRPDGVISRSRAGLLFIESYRELPLLSWPRKLIDSFVALEQSMLLFRSSHARMVERMIGRRMGTGGSSGVDYLDATTKYRVFVDLWAVRTMLVKREALPDVEQAGFYGFAVND